MNLHRAADGAAAVAILLFLVLEYGLSLKFVSGTVLAVGDAALHILIFGTIAWHLLHEKLNGHQRRHSEHMTHLRLRGDK